MGRRDISATVMAMGVVRPMVGAEVKVGSRVSGVVTHLRANIGDHVQAGEVIAEIDPAEFRARLAQNEASLARAQAEAALAQLNLDRLGTMAEREFVSQQQVDAAESALQVARAQERLATANLESARIQLSYTRITAPVGGVVASVATQEGETVAASFAAPTFVNIIDLDRLEVQAFVDETDIGRIQEGQAARFSVDSYPAEEFEGQVTAIYPKAVIQDNVVNYVVTIQHHRPKRPDAPTGDDGGRHPHPGTPGRHPGRAHGGRGSGALGTLRHGHGEGFARPENGAGRLDAGWLDRRSPMVSPRASASYFRSDEGRDDGAGR